MKRFFIIFIFLFFLSKASYSQDIGKIISEADTFYISREVIEHCEKSITLYEKALKLDPKNYEACWKIARSCKWLGDKYPEEKRIEILEKGEKYARKAIEINPQGAEGHFWLGVCLGRIGEERGVLNSLFLVGPIKEEMEKVLKIDPNHDGAHHVLGVLFRKAPGWPLSIGNIEKAKEHALFAVKLKPDRILNHVGLAEVYIEMKNYKEAKEELLTALSLPFEEDRIPEGRDDKKRASILLEEVKTKLGE